jgi:soluble lytic murein transglycosylase
MDLGPRRKPRRYLWAAIVVFVAVVAGLSAWWFRRAPPTLEESPENYRILVIRYADRSNLPQVFVHKVVLAESGGDPLAVSKVNAKGLMQILPAAETDVLKKLKRSERGDLFDPEYNMLIGTTYLRMLTDRFGGDAYLVLGAYHMGPTSVARYRAANPGISGKDLIKRFAGPATRAYCARILQGRELRLPVTRRRAGPTDQPVF